MSVLLKRAQCSKVFIIYLNCHIKIVWNLLTNIQIWILPHETSTFNRSSHFLSLPSRFGSVKNEPLDDSPLKTSFLSFSFFSFRFFFEKKTKTSLWTANERRKQKSRKRKWRMNILERSIICCRESRKTRFLAKRSLKGHRARTNGQ